MPLRRPISTISHPELPKIISVFYSDQGNVQRVTYIVRLKEIKTIKQLLGDVTNLLKITADEETDYFLVDLNGKKVSTLKELYYQSPSSFILKNELEDNDDNTSTTDLESKLKPKLKQIRGSSATKNRTIDRNVSQDTTTWVYGNSKLRYGTVKPIGSFQNKQSPKKTQRKIVSRAPRMMTEERNKEKQEQVEQKAKEARTEESKDKRNGAKRKTKGITKKKPSKTQQENERKAKQAEKESSELEDDGAENETISEVSESKEKPEKTSSEEEKPKPNTFIEQYESQIMAKERQIRSLQEKMQEGESFLDRIGQTNQPKTNPCVIFAMDLRMENKPNEMMEKKKGSPNRNERVKSDIEHKETVIRPQTTTIKRPTIQTPHYPSKRDNERQDDDDDDDSARKTQIRPQTVTLRRHTAEDDEEKKVKDEKIEKEDELLSTIDE